MKEKRKDFINLLDDLCNIYKEYIRSNNNSNLEVIIQDNMINMYLYDDNELIDTFGLSFNNKEYDKYRYVSIVLMKLLFGSNVIYSKDNIFLSDKDKFRIVVNNEDIFNSMFNMACIHRDNNFYKIIDNNGRIRNKINKNKDISIMDERVEISRNLVKSRSIK